MKFNLVSELIAVALISSPFPILCILYVYVLRFNGHLKLPAQVSIIGFVKGVLSELCLSWTGPRFTASSPECPYPGLSSLVVLWRFLGPSLSSYVYNQSAVCVRGFRLLWLSLVMQWQQGMQQQENLTASIGKETRRQNKSKFGLCLDKLQPASSDKIIWAQIRDGPVFWGKRCKVWTRWLSLSQDRLVLTCCALWTHLIYRRVGPTAVNAYPYSFPHIDSREDWFCLFLLEVFLIGVFSPHIPWNNTNLLPNHISDIIV